MAHPPTLDYAAPSSERRPGLITWATAAGLGTGAGFLVDDNTIVFVLACAAVSFVVAIVSRGDSLRPMVLAAAFVAVGLNLAEVLRLMALGKAGRLLPMLPFFLALYLMLAAIGAVIGGGPAFLLKWTIRRLFSSPR